MEDDNYIVYLLKNSNNNCTYVGITNNPERRIRQHNGEIKGGARYTTMNLSKQSGDKELFSGEQSSKENTNLSNQNKDKDKDKNKNKSIWSYHGFIPGLDKRLALSIEKKIHIHSRKYKGSNPLEKRLNCINSLLKEYENIYFIVI